MKWLVKWQWGPFLKDEWYCSDIDVIAKLMWHVWKTNWHCTGMDNLSLIDWMPRHHIFSLNFPLTSHREWPKWIHILNHLKNVYRELIGRFYFGHYIILYLKWYILRKIKLGAKVLKFKVKGFSCNNGKYKGLKWET